MKREGRWLFNFAAVVSLVLCVATMAMLVRSYVVSDTLKWQSKPDPGVNSVSVISDRGGMVVWRMRENLAASEDRFSWTRRDPEGYLAYSIGNRRRVGIQHQLLGFGYLKDVPLSFFLYTSSSSAVFAPHWAVLLVTATGPLFWLRSRAKFWSRRRRHQCLSCGYDLRATPDRCPECGAIPNGIKLITSPRRQVSAKEEQN
jgi:hypothetical protein